MKEEISWYKSGSDWGWMKDMKSSWEKYGIWVEGWKGWGGDEWRWIGGRGGLGFIFYFYNKERGKLTKNPSVIGTW